MKKGLDIKIEGLECPGIITIESLITYPPSRGGNKGI